jgi:hypothetical protein
LLSATTLAMSNPPLNVTVPLQPGTRKLVIQPMDDGFVVFIAGVPGSALCNYVYLRNDGSIQRVHEAPDKIHIVTVKDASK